MDISQFGKLNGIYKEKKLFWGIRKSYWEDFYNIEVSSHNFDKRPSLHEEVKFIDDAIDKMTEFAENI